MSDRRLSWLLRFYPERFRRTHGEEYLAFLQAQREEPRYRGPVGAMRFWVGVVGGAALAGLRARLAGGGSASLPAELPRAARRLRRRPGLAVAVVATLGVAMGIAMATFAVVDEALLAPLPYSTGDRLVLVRNDIPAMEWYDEPVGRWVWQPLEEEAEGLFESMTATRTTRVNLILEGEPRAAQALQATAAFFTVFDARPALGRGFTADEDRPESDPVVVLGHGLWTRLYGADPSIVGQPLEVDGVLRRVVGVLPEDFVIPGGEAEMILPLAPDRARTPVVGNHDHQVYALLEPGLSAVEAAGRIAPFTPLLDERYPQIDLARFDFRVHLTPLGEVLRGDVRATLLLLMGAGGLLLLLASSNVANLMLARTEGSRLDQSVRLSLGASHGSLAREALAESALLAGAGSAVGLGLAALLLGAAPRLPADLLPWTVVTLGVDGGTLAFAGTLALLATVVVGALPAWGVRRTRPADLLGVHRGSGSEGRALVRRGLVVSQIFLSVVLLTGATLLGRTLLALAETDPGFRAEQVVTVDVQLPRERYGDWGAMAELSRTLAERVGALPSVEAAGVTDAIPLRELFSAGAVRIEGDDPEAEGRFHPDAHVQIFAGDYLGAMGIPLLVGQAPRPGVPGVLVNRAFASELLPEGRALQQRVAVFSGDFLPVRGVVGDVRLNDLSEAPEPQIYYSMDAWVDLQERRLAAGVEAREGAVPLTVVIRTPEETAAATVEAVRTELRALDPGIPVASVRALEEVVVADRARPRLTALVVGGLALAGLLLAAVGTYAVLAHSVSTRSREMGIRKALGASPRTLWRGTTLSGLGLAGAGLVAGLVAARLGARVLDGLLYGVAGDEPLTYVAVVVLVGTVALAATAGPALRAARVDPVESIRE